MWININFSYRYCLFASLLYIALMLISLVTLPYGIFIAVLLLCACCWTLWHKVLMRAGGSIIACYFDDKRCIMLDNRGQESYVELQGSSTISRYVMILHFKSQGFKRSMILFRDALPIDQYRQLRAYLHTGHSSHRRNGVQCRSKLWDRI